MPFLFDSDLSAARNLHVSFAALWYFDLRAIVPVDSYIDIRYILMILNLSGKTSQAIYDGINSRYSRIVPVELHAKARRLLDQIDAAPDTAFLRIPPGN